MRSCGSPSLIAACKPQKAELVSPSLVRLLVVVNTLLYILYKIRSGSMETMVSTFHFSRCVI